MGWQGAAAVFSAVLGTYSAASSADAQRKAENRIKDQAAIKPPQASKAPDASSVANAMSGAGQAGGAAGVAQTFLTGAGGIDPSLLKLGKNTLLGG
jgi:hypothetical protein